MAERDPGARVRHRARARRGAVPRADPLRSRAQGRARDDPVHAEHHRRAAHAHRVLAVRARHVPRRLAALRPRRATASSSSKASSNHPGSDASASRSADDPFLYPPGPCPNTSTSTRRTSSPKAGVKVSGRERWFELAAVLLLSLATRRHRVERLPGRPLERAAGPELRAGQRRPRAGQPGIDARRPGADPGPAQFQPLARGVQRGELAAHRSLSPPLPTGVRPRVRGVARAGPAATTRARSRPRC